MDNLCIALFSGLQKLTALTQPEQDPCQSMLGTSQNTHWFCDSRIPQLYINELHQQPYIPQPPMYSELHL